MLDKILAAAEAHFEDHVTRLQRFIRQPSVSAESRGNDEMAAMLAEEIRVLGGKAEVVPGVDFPIVYGRIDSGAPRTVLIHSMYDTTPATEPEWIVPPFDAVRMDFENFGEMMMAQPALFHYILPDQFGSAPGVGEPPSRCRTWKEMPTWLMNRKVG